MKRKAVVETISILFIFLFVYAATSKLIEYEKFKVQLGQSPLLTDFASWIAWLVPAIEIIISVLLAIKQLKLMGLYASFSLMVMFTAYIIGVTRFSDNIPCSCGGILESMGWNAHLLFNFSFVFLAIIGIFLHNKHTSQRIPIPSSA